MNTSAWLARQNFDQLRAYKPKSDLARELKSANLRVLAEFIAEHEDDESA